MENFTPYSALIGGALIGLSANLMLLLNGRVAGISGILEGILKGPHTNWSNKVFFLFGLLAGGLALLWGYPQAFTGEVNVGVPLLVASGLFVGFGTRLGSGCTSGHGVCGLSRLSTRSLFATLVFMGAGFATASGLHGVLWGQS